MKLFATFSMLCATLLSSPAALAQQESQDDQERSIELEEIVVTGFRSSNLASIQAKQNADGVVDAVAQDQIGLLPDLDITQVAQRIPGLSVISTFGVENDRSGDDTEAIVIRGLDPNFNLVTFDGVPIASADENDRRTKTSIIPPSVVGRVEAVKTLTARHNPHGLSGQLNLVTASAFDYDGQHLSTRLSFGENSTAGNVVTDDDLDTRADAVFSTRFGSDEQFGIVVAGSYHNFFSTNYEDKPGARDDTYLFYVSDPLSNDQTTDLSLSNGFPAARRVQIFAFDDERERTSGLVKLEFRPSEQTEGYVYYGRFEETESEQRHEYLAVAEEDDRPLNQTATSGTWAEGRLELGFVNQPEETTTDILTSKLSHHFDDDHAVNIALSYSESNVDVVRNMSKFRPSLNADGAFSYDLSSGQPVITFTNPTTAGDLTNFGSNYIRARNQTIENELLFADVNYGFNFEPSDGGWGFSAGLSVTRRDNSFDREYREGDVFNTVGCVEPDITDCPLATLDQFVLTEITGAGPGVPFTLIDDAAFRAAWESQGEPITNDRSDNSIRDDYELEEDIFAAYFQTSYRTDTMTFIGGLRYDRAETHVDLFAEDEALDDDPNDAAQYVPQSRDADYDFVLPSLLASFDLSENWILRLGYGRTIGRPNFSDYALGESIGEPDNGSVSITRGNPDLEPRVSDNFDASLEYYFDGGASLFAAAVFYKDVDNLIFEQEQIVENFQFEGQSLTARITQPVNGNAAHISGLELTLRKDFSETLPEPLDGLVLNTNVTFLDGEVTFPDANGINRTLDGWEKQPEFLFNLQLSYEKGPFGTKVAYNYVDDYINNANDEDPLFDVFRDARSEVDLQLRFQATDSLKLLLEVQNLTEEEVTSERQFGFGVNDLLAQRTEKGRRVWFGVQWVPSL